MNHRFVAWALAIALIAGVVLPEPRAAQAGCGEDGSSTTQSKDNKKKKKKKKSKKKDDTQTGSDSPKHRYPPGWIPPWLPETEKADWKDGRPPGWSRGFKAGDLPPGHEKWDATQRSQWEKGLATSRERLDTWMKGRPAPVPDPDKQSVLVSLEAGVRSGIPPSACVDVIQSALEKGFKPDEIGRVTRAWADGERENVNSDLLHSFIFNRLQRKMKADDIALDVYEEIETRRNAAAKKP